MVVSSSFQQHLSKNVQKQEQIWYKPLRLLLLPIISFKGVQLKTHYKLATVEGEYKIIGFKNQTRSEIGMETRRRKELSSSDTTHKSPSCLTCKLNNLLILKQSLPISQGFRELANALGAVPALFLSLLLSVDDYVLTAVVHSAPLII